MRLEIHQPEDKGSLDMLTIGVHGFAIWRSNTKDAGNENILKARDKEECRVLVIESFELFVIHIGLSVPVQVSSPSRPHSVLAYQDCLRTHTKTNNCTAALMIICPMILVKTFFDTKLAVGLFGCNLGYGNVRPTDK